MYEIGNETYCWTKEMKRITFAEHHIKGLENITHSIYTKSIESIPLHFHRNIIEIHCVAKGQRNCVLERSGELIQYRCLGSQAFITYPIEVHSNGLESSPPHEYFGLQINISDPYTLLGMNRENSFALYQNLIHLPSRHLSVTKVQLDFLSNAFQLIADPVKPNIPLAVQLINCFLFSLCLMSPVDQDTIITNVSPAIQKAISYLKQNITEELQVTDLSNISGYSLSHFKSVFKKEIGITPAEYINLQKFEIAKKMLLESNISITDLASSLGFSSPSYFCAVFKKYSTLTPQMYRKRYTNLPEIKSE